MSTLDRDKGPQLVGNLNEANISINGTEAKALLDTGSCVSILSKGFYDKYLSETEIKPLSQILNVQCADGNDLPYLGCIEADITTIEGMHF